MSIRNLIFRLWPHINLRRRKQFALLLFLTIFASFAELISLGSVVPFLSALSNPENILKSQSFQSIATFFGIKSANQLVFWLTISFCAATIFSGFLRVMVLIATAHLSFAAGSDLSVSIYRKTLYQEYSVHLLRNSSEIVDGISTKANSMIYGVILPLLTLISSIVMLLAIFVILIYISPAASLLSIFTFGSVYIFLIKFTRNRKIINSEIITKQSTQIVKSLQEGLGGIRDVIIDGTQDTFCNIYKQADKQLRDAQKNNQIISLSPRYLIESMGMILIAMVALYIFGQDDGVQNAIPVLGLFALSAQRLLPIMQQAYASWSSIQGSYASLRDILSLLDQPLSLDAVNGKNEVHFKNSIKLVNINFKYNSHNQNAIQNINFTIQKGDRVGLVGLTGGGKSTLVDILMGLLSPTAGQLMVDDIAINRNNVKEWQHHIAHVPQAIFLSDASIAENIAFGVKKEEINLERVFDAANKAQLDSVIMKLPHKYNTLVGERGVRLSGGQRQRIGIARALYKNADVLIFDEATSALDGKTEESIMDSINALGDHLTIIMVAHRITTLRECKKIIELDSGEIVRISNYDQLIHQTK